MNFDPSVLIGQLGDIDPTRLIASLIVIFFGIGIHEYAHAKFADMAGDPTPSIYGRVTLNLFKHFDPIGTIMIVLTSIAGIGIGWGKPVPMNPAKMRNPKWDHFVAVLAGPISNIAQAVVWSILFRLAPDESFLLTLATMGILINLSLCFFNLLPMGPLDGMWLLGTFLSEKARWAWTKFNLGPGQFIFLGLVLMGQLTGFSIIYIVIGPPVFFLFNLLTR